MRMTIIEHWLSGYMDDGFSTINFPPPPRPLMSFAPAFHMTNIEALAVSLCLRDFEKVGEADTAFFDVLKTLFKALITFLGSFFYFLDFYLKRWMGIL